MTLRKSAAGSGGWRRSSTVRLTRRYLEDFWRWWMGELRPIMPLPLRELLFREHVREVIELDGELVRISRAGAAGESPQVIPLGALGTQARTSDAAERVLVLPGDRVITRRAVLPLAAEENLREVLAFEMDRLTPFTPDRVYFDARVTDRDGATRMLMLELLVAPRRDVDPLLARLGEAGLAPDVVTARDGSGSGPLALNLLAENVRPAWRTVTRVNVVVGLVALLLLGTAAVLPLIEKQHRLSELEPQLGQAIADAARARDLETQVDRLVSGSSYLVRKKRQEVSVLATLNALTQVLPEHTWVERFGVEGRSVSIEGVSGSAETLIGLLERSGQFENVHFESPVVRHERQTVDRFHISANVERSATHD